MSLFVASLNSGSNGNCYYAGTLEDAVLIDAGISCRETERRMKRLGLSMKKVRALLVTHEHADHIAGVERISRKYELPVYITSETLQQSRVKSPRELPKHFTSYESFQFGSVSGTAIPKAHDAADPHSFVIQSDTVKVGIFTDTGWACEHIRSHFSQCHAAFLESNYDTNMLENGGYPQVLKDRIRGGKGHLSNAEALQLFMQHRPPHMTHLFLSHLSENNNSIRLARGLFESVAGHTKIIVASRKKETKLYHIRHKPGIASRPEIAKSEQLSLF
ncbi:MAG: MBL fold metallo-hydrolase [Bacteroidetes bacterium]|nr:MBL fold metallo-hydrolase [Bacteroidota bacterium]